MSQSSSQPTPKAYEARPQAVGAQNHLAILKQGVVIWNRWRKDNPDIEPDLEGADLRGAALPGVDLHAAHIRNARFLNADLAASDFSKADLADVSFEGADLHEAKLSGALLKNVSFENADLRDANLDDNVTGLQAGQLKGADLSGATLPADIVKFEALANVEEASRNARKLFLSMQLVCAYSLLTAATTKDAALLTNTATTPLPIINVQVPVVGFYLLTPVLLLGFYTYFHLYLQRLWEALADLPAVFPDGRPLDRAAYPWLLNGMICAARPMLARHRPSLFRLEYLASVVAAWCIVPLTILGLWGRFLPRQDAAGTAWHVVCVLIATTAGFVFFGLAVHTLRGGGSGGLGRLSGAAQLGRAMGVLTVQVGFAGFCYVSGSITSGEFFGFTFFNANFERQDVSTKMAGWDWQDLDLREVQGALLAGRNLRYAKTQGAFLVKADLRGADLTGADLRDAYLIGADLRDANLYWADLRRADLTGATGLTQTQLDQARGNSDTKLTLSESLRLPSHWSKQVVSDAKHEPIRAGSFQMGCSEADEECGRDESPPHDVTIGKDFEMQAHEVTVAQYKRFAQDTGREMPPSPSFLGTSFNIGWVQQDHPIVNASWEDANAYCGWADGRLPTEAEWEYAARGGEQGLKFPNANELTHEDANLRGTEGRDLFEYTSPVGEFPPNGFCLYDMAGNVWEWTADWYEADYYEKSPAEDPPGPETGDFRVVRGGSWGTLTVGPARVGSRRGSFRAAGTSASGSVAPGKLSLDS